MEESKDTKRDLSCPFCSAPRRGVVPSDAATLKCEYCGSLFSVSPNLKDTAQRCPNHPETFATGLCNDCGGRFCTRCIFPYNLRTESDRVRLYLCSDCFHKRHLKKAESIIYAGVFFLFGGFLVFVFTPILGVLMILGLSIPMIVYGFYEKSSLPKDASVYIEKEGHPTITEKPSELTLDVDELYGKMLSKDMMRWGVLNAKERLDGEIYAHMRYGLSYEEAVFRVARARGILGAESLARAKAEPKKETKETRESRMVR